MKADELILTKEEFVADMLSALYNHRERHPLMQIWDVIKFVFQGMLGVGHLLADRDAVQRYIAMEMDGQVCAKEEPLIEVISPAWSRLNLRGAVAERLSPTVIANMMIASESCMDFSRSDVARVCESFAKELALPFGPKDARQILEESWLPSHSELYRAAYHPAYRVIASDWEALTPAICTISKSMATGKRVLVTVDGPCASGKTTMAGKLAKAFDASVLHTDDFVVPHTRKTPERLSVPGGNCDWERLVREALAPWKKGERPRYQRYDCHTDCLLAPETLDAERVVILEGSYCNLPAIVEYADVQLFLNASEDVRMERLRMRESPQSLQRFHERWIPLEKAYFQTYGLPDRNCLIL